MYANAVRLMDRAVRTCGCPFPNYIAQHGSAVVVGPTRAGSPVQTKGSSSSFLRSTSSRTTNATWRNICGRAQLGLTVSCHRALHLAYHHWLTWATLRLLCCVTDRSTPLARSERRCQLGSMHGRSPNAYGLSWIDATTEIRLNIERGPACLVGTFL